MHPHEYYVVYTLAEQKAEKYPDFWLRPYDMFAEMVEVDGMVISRFKKID